MKPKKTSKNNVRKKSCPSRKEVAYGVIREPNKKQDPVFNTNTSNYLSLSPPN